jgi:indolepyruvate ferredoxin oxidoreductase
MTAHAVSLDDRYRLAGDPYYLNGTQSLVRLLQLEKRRRAEMGRNTAVYLTGYRGSPVGGLDQEMLRAAAMLGPDIVLNPAINEDLAATAVWGTQQLGVFGAGRYDGVSAAWYGKGPGVDRSGDAFKHGNLAGSAREGGVLVITGDDHTCKSSTTAHQSEYALVDAMIPVLAPASISEQMAYGLTAWEMSRYAGVWAGLKVVTEIMDSSESVQVDPVVDLVLPDEFAIPAGGLSLRWPDSALAQEERLHKFKIPAALTFSRANRIDRVVFGHAAARLGLVTVGKAHADTMQALADLGLDEARAAAMGIRLYKVGMPWPLEPEGIAAFARGLSRIVVIEEKRGLVEDQLRNHLYGKGDAPVIEGKRDKAGEWLFPSNGDLGAAAIAAGLGLRILEITDNDDVRRCLEAIEVNRTRASGLETLAQRPPHFCAGCPHNTSTRVPEGSAAFAGIGCHFLSQSMERQTAGYTQMGGEGAQWVGLAPFSSTPHMFQNIGDGTYIHSGSLAIRAAIAAGVNITYKILFNDAVAMTGGQSLDSGMTVGRLAAQMVAEGAHKVVIVSEDPSRARNEALPSGVEVRHREQLDETQRELREVLGVSILIYDQTCATELRRLRKRGKAPDPKVAVFINDLVCEGCGDCSRASNCLAVTPLDTEFGRKRAIDLASCNKDLSCLEGFCPSFVTVEGGQLRKAGAVAPPDVPLPAVSVGRAGIVVAGVGGTGVVTIGGILGMAAHIDGKVVRVMDMTGLAQKGGAVVSHIQIAPAESRISAAKVSLESADLMIACDLVVAAAPENLACLSRDGRVVANDHETATGEFTRNATFSLPMRRLKRTLSESVDDGRANFCDATVLADKLVGDAVGANLFLVGWAWQLGAIPLSLEAIERAIELNGAAVTMNRNAFAWGRCAAHDMAAVENALAGERPAHHQISESLEEAIARRAEFLTQYQNATYASRYTNLIDKIREAERIAAPGQDKLAMAVAHSMFKLMAYKDEYEVARLHTDTGFLASVHARVSGAHRVYYHLAPPILGKRDRVTGIPRKSRFGGWMYWVFKIMAKGRVLRGTVFDVFGYTTERQLERRLIEDYRALIEDRILPVLSTENYGTAVALAAVAQDIRGYGHVKLGNVEVARSREAELMAAFAAQSVVSPMSGNRHIAVS